MWYDITVAYVFHQSFLSEFTKEILVENVPWLRSIFWAHSFFGKRNLVKIDQNLVPKRQLWDFHKKYTLG